MYAPFFGLSKEPFSIAPDPRFLFMSEQHREALAHLLYGLGGGGGFVLLTGEIGAGKTTVFRCFLEQVPAHCTVAYVFNPKLTAVELLQTVCGEFGLPPPLPADSVKAHVDALNAFLLDGHAQGRQAVLVIDEAQSLPADVLEQLRLLTNLETSERKLLQIVLIGQPELRDMLARPDLEQLAQRVIARYHLGALTAGETQQYIRHRFAVAGAKAPLPFSQSALQRIHELAGGVPRRINLLADRALLGAYAQGHTRVERRTVAQAAREVFGRAPAAAPAWGWAAGGALAVMAVGAAVWALWPAPGREPAAPVAQVSSAPASVAAASAAASAPITPAFDSPEALLAAAQPQPAIAWRELALRWNVAIGEGDPCVAAAQARLACFRSPTGGLALLRQVSRPAVLALRAPRGPALHAVLVALDDSSATLQAGGRNFRLPLQALLDLWRGDVATFWRVPPGWREGSELSADPQGRSWLSEKLGAAGHGGERPLLERVWAFQLAQGLPLDGLAGPLTLMQLNRAVGVDEPRLTAPR
jgi:general secretion pathway protein A